MSIVTTQLHSDKTSCQSLSTQSTTFLLHGREHVCSWEGLLKVSSSCCSLVVSSKDTLNDLTPKIRLNPVGPAATYESLFQL
jgi:hypothetical protein